MKITNKYGVPETIMALANKNYYSKGGSNYSVTELISPPRIQRLRRKHWDEMETDVADMIWQLFGSALHVVAERSIIDGHQNEERLHIDIDGVTLSGAIDVQKYTDRGVVISDYKMTSVWAYMNYKIEWEIQQNLYAWLVHEVKGLDVAGVQICAFLRDWSRARAKTTHGYPQAPIVTIDLPLWDFKRTEAYARERIGLHNISKMSADLDEELPLCTDEEKWTRPPVYAVKKEGRKTAIKLYEKKEEADEHVLASTLTKEKLYVETRRGESVRCSGDYCGVSKWCSQYRKENPSGDE